MVPKFATSTYACQQPCNMSNLTPSYDMKTGSTRLWKLVISCTSWAVNPMLTVRIARLTAKRIHLVLGVLRQLKMCLQRKNATSLSVWLKHTLVAPEDQVGHDGHDRERHHEHEHHYGVVVDVALVCPVLIVKRA